MAQRLRNPIRIHEDVGLIPGLAQWITDQALQTRLGSSVAVGLASAGGYSSNQTPWPGNFHMGAALKKQKKDKKKKKKIWSLEDTHLSCNSDTKEIGVYLGKIRLYLRAEMEGEIKSDNVQSYLPNRAFSYHMFNILKFKSHLYLGHCQKTIFIPAVII